MKHEESDDLAALRWECHLTIGVRIGCECAPYFIRRRSVLIPAVMRCARARRTDPVDLFAAFARGVHARHLDGLSLAVA